MSWNTYGVWKQRQSSTCIDNCVTASLFSQDAAPSGLSQSELQQQLITAGPGMLRVYSIKPQIGTLRLLFELPLFGDPMSVATLSLSQSLNASMSSAQVILCSFAPAKLSVMEYSKLTGDFRTTGVLSFDSVPKTFETEVFTPIIAVDPKQRCCAMVVSCTAVAIIPALLFRQSNWGKQHSVDASILSDPFGASNSSNTLYYVQDLAYFQIKRIREIVFLHGYHEPTILVLHEPYHTWEGRSAVRRNSCQVVAFSLDLTRKQVSLICSSELLPLSTHKILPVPEPIGGAILISLNQIFYFSQSIDAILSLNEFGDRHQHDFRVQSSPTGTTILEVNRGVGGFLNPSQIILSNDAGVLYLLQIEHEADTVFGLKISQCGNAPNINCISILSRDYVFMGSRLSDSLLFHTNIIQETSEEEQNSTMDVESESGQNQESKEEDLEIFLFGQKLDTGSDASKLVMKSSNVSNFSLELKDRILNIAPQPQFSLVYNMLDERGQRNSNINLSDCFTDYVCCSGSLNGTSLSVLENGVRSFTLRSFTLNSFNFNHPIIGSWTAKRFGSDLDCFLFISFQNSSAVFFCENELKLISNSIFYTNGRTVAAGNLCHNSRLVQIHSYGVLLIDISGATAKKVQDLMIGDEVEQINIVQAHILDPYILLLLSNGTVQLLDINNPDSLLSLSIPPLLSVSQKYPQFQISDGKVTAISLHCDHSGLFKLSSNKSDANEVMMEEEDKGDLRDDHGDAIMSEDIETLLYGGAIENLDVPLAVEEVLVEENMAKAGEILSEKDFEPMYVCAIARSDGRLEIYSLPQFTPLFWCSSFPVGYMHYENHIIKSSFSVTTFDEVFVEELLLSTLSDENSGTCLIGLLSSGDLLIYRVFHCNVESNETCAPIRIAKFRHSLIVKKTSNSTKSGTMKEGPGDFNMEAEVKDSSNDVSIHDGATVLSSPSVQYVKRLHKFGNICNQSGFFIDSYRPLWLFSSRDFLYPHFDVSKTQFVDANISASSCSAFTPLNTDFCSKGFIRFNEKNLEIRRLSDLGAINYDLAYPTRKIPFEKTVRYVAYSPDSGTVSVILCEKKVTFSLEELEERSPPVFESVFQLNLVVLGSYKTVDKFDGFNSKEVVLCLKSVKLYKNNVMSRTVARDDGTNYIAIGTSNFEGEDVLCRGRVILFEVYDTSPSDLSGAGLRYKLICDLKEKGVVSAIANVSGLLCLAIGNRIIMYSFDGASIRGCAFIDVSFYVASMSSVKNFIAVGDVCKSIVLLYWEYELQQLEFVGKDYNSSEVYSCDFFISNNDLSVILADSEGNVQFLGHTPDRPGSRGGERLLPRADFFVGHRITDMHRLRARFEHRKNYLTLCSCDSGVVGFFLGMDELTYRRMYSLHTQLTFKIHHYAGLNPKMYRTFQVKNHFGYQVQRNIVDGDLLWQYIGMDFYQQRKLARNIGTTPEQIIENLNSIDLAATIV